MSDLICPFSATLAKKDFACPRAVPIIRRGGTEFACNSAAAHARCTALHGLVRQDALRRLDLQDDLATLPQSMLVKIQFGTLLGLARVSAVSADRTSGYTPHIDDVDALIEAAIRQYGAPEMIPFAELFEDIRDYRIERRRRG